MQDRSLISEAHYEWMRLYTRLKVYGAIPDGQIRLPGFIQPIIDFESMFWTPGGGQETRNLSVDADEFFEVPLGKRWKVRHIWRSSTVTPVALYVEDREGARVSTLIVSQTAEAVFSPGVDLTMDQGWSIFMGQGGGGDTSITMEIIYDEADAW